jgi:hypothetical protein
MLILCLSLLTAILTGFLGAWGGAEGTSKGWRRTGIPMVWMIHLFIVLQSPWILFVWLHAIGIGYGIPSVNDEGSAIGAFWYNKTGSAKSADILTRSTIGTIHCLMLLFIPILSGGWIAYAIGSLIYILGNVLFGGNAIIKEEGTFNIFNKSLLFEEFIIHFINTVGVLTMLHGGTQ